MPPESTCGASFQSRRVSSTTATFLFPNTGIIIVSDAVFACTDHRPRLIPLLRLRSASSYPKMRVHLHRRSSNDGRGKDPLAIDDRTARHPKPTLRSFRAGIEQRWSSFCYCRRNFGLASTFTICVPSAYPCTRRMHIPMLHRVPLALREQALAAIKDCRLGYRSRCEHCEKLIPRSHGLTSFFLLLTPGGGSKVDIRSHFHNGHSDVTPFLLAARLNRGFVTPRS